MAVAEDLESAEPAAASPAEQQSRSSTVLPALEHAALWLRSENRLLGLIALLSIVVAVGIGMSYGLALAMLVIAGGALVSVIGLLWGSVQNLTGEAALSFDEALSLAAPTAEEEQKRALLRALKDLEYERSVGKIGEEDYQELSARYREEAKRLLQLLEKVQEPARQRVDELVRKRLVQEGLAEPGAPRKTKKKKTAKAEARADGQSARSGAAANMTEGADSASAAIEGENASAGPTDAGPAEAGLADAPQPDRAQAAPTRKCGACEARNDLDARFCKRCGQALSADEQALCSACPAVYDKTLAACPECGVERGTP